MTEPETGTAVRHIRWSDLPLERVTNMIDRKVITGELGMLAQIYLRKGAVVPQHRHENEQITFVLKGALRFFLGEDATEEIDVLEGEVLHIPGNVPHKALALEETIDVDVFCPPRQDWLDGTDTYFKDQ